MIPLEQLERDILAMLEEAGEEAISSLLNSVRECNGKPKELILCGSSLLRLIGDDLIQVGVSPRAGQAPLKPLAKPVAIKLIENLKSTIQWSQTDHIWKFVAEPPHLKIILAPRGLIVARGILSEDGWPQRRPWDWTE